jgi:hypothetical protein
MPFPQADALWRHFHQLIIIDIRNRLFQLHAPHTRHDRAASIFQKLCINSKTEGPFYEPT